MNRPLETLPKMRIPDLNDGLHDGCDIVIREDDLAFGIH
jgi:hypothetical protein